LVERNLAKVEVESSRLFSRSKLVKKGKLLLPFFVEFCDQQVAKIRWRDSKSVMQWIANPSSPVRLWVAPPDVSSQTQSRVSAHRPRGPSGEIGRHIGLKIRRFVNNGRTGSIPVSGTITPSIQRRACLNWYAIGCESLTPPRRCLIFQTCMPSPRQCWHRCFS
jgi:hypothetical protein